MGLQQDFTGAIRKTNTLLHLDKAVKANLTDWGSGTVKGLKISAGAMHGAYRHHGKKTGALARSIGLKITVVDGHYQLVVGTGLGSAAASRSAEKYASIQDRGGTTHPTVTKRMRGWAWFMFGKWHEDKYKAIALTKKDRLTIHIPASHWFSDVTGSRLSILNSRYMNDDTLLRTAERLSGGTHAD